MVGDYGGLVVRKMRGDLCFDSACTAEYCSVLKTERGGAMEQATYMGDIDLCSIEFSCLNSAGMVLRCIK